MRFNARTGRKDKKGEEGEKLREQKRGRTRQPKDEKMNKEGKSLQKRMDRVYLTGT